MVNNKNQYSRKPYPRRRKHSGRSVALAFTVVILLFTAVIAFSPSFRDLLASSLRSDVVETDAVKSTSDADHITESSGDPETTTTTAVPTTTVFEDIDIELVGTGDVLLHMPVIEGVRRSVDGETVYQFEPVFKYVREIIESADYSVFNFEGTLGGEPYSGYPMFSAPDDIIPALKTVGFDLGSTVNNHSIDRGMDGLLRTISVFEKFEMPNIGTKSAAENKSYRIEDINGIKIGFSSYTYETIGTEQNRALNGITMSADLAQLVDSFNPYRDNIFQEDIQEILLRVETMKKEGAEFICMVMHWGDEYHVSSNPYQQSMAQKLADAGVDLVIGHHPHVVQEIDFVKSANSDHEMLIYYSLGNFISNQYYDTGGAAGKGQDGLMARINIRKTEDDVFITSAEYIPTHVVRVTADGIASHRVVPVLDALESPAEFETTSDLMRTSLARTSAIMEANGSSDRISLEAAGY
jgi:poly-gamma-glutamate synthesis protein (capsule biosynthesis protein)